MGRPYRFDLDKALAAWRRSLAFDRTFLRDDLEELEQHLRDQVSDLVGEGLTEQEAFRVSMREMGDLTSERSGYRRTYWGKRRRRGETIQELFWRFAMLRNYLKVALRDIQKHKGYTLINVSGLAVGLACFALIGLFVRFELSYDRFHEKADRIYRIVRETPNHPLLGNTKMAQTPPPLLPMLLEEFPEVEYATQIMPANSLFKLGGQKFYEDGLFATSQFFDVFSFEMLEGDPGSALADPTSIVLTESLARKYFAGVDPVGKSIPVTHSIDAQLSQNANSEMKVTGIVEDPPSNSHLSFDFLVPVSSSVNLVPNLHRWGNNRYYTYVSLQPDHSLPHFAEKLSAATARHLGEERYFKNHPEYVNLFLPQPLTDIHLHSHFVREISVNGDVRYVYLFSAIGVLFLLIACINYTNLTTARGATRNREVGARKVMGARRKQLIAQFMGEAIVPSLFAVFIAAIVVASLLPALNALTGRQIHLDLAEDGRFLSFLFAIGIGAGVLAGGYPAFVMSSFHPVSMMRGEQTRVGGTSLRNVLVIVQFTITFVLIVGTLVIQRQLRYIQDADSGVDRDLVVSIEIHDPLLHQRYSALKETLTRHANVLGVTAAEQDPTLVTFGSYVDSLGADENQPFLVYRTSVQDGFVDMFDIEILDGRDFSTSKSTDVDEGVLINEALVRRLGWDAAVGKRLKFNNWEFEVLGVMKDFTFNSFRMEVAPFALLLNSEKPNPSYPPESFKHVLVKVSPNDIQETVAFIGATMTEFSPEYPIEYHFLDDAYDDMYRTEIRLGGLFGYLTGLALCIACLGLLGLAAFTVSQRTKEIGIRKALGASIQSIVMLLSSDFLKLVGVALVVGAAPAYLVAHRWLEEFAYRIDVGIGTFLLAGSIVLVIATLTVSYRAIDAALTDPVRSLRYE